MVFNDYYLQPDAPDPILNEELVVSVVRRHVPSAGRVLEIDETGGEARAYLLEGGVVLKTQRPQQLRPRTSLKKEAFFLGELEKSPAICVPRVLGYGEVEGTEYICMTRVVGRAFRLVEMKPQERAHVLFDLGRTLRQVHDADQRAFAESGLFPGDVGPSDLRARFGETFDRLNEVLESDSNWNGAMDVRALASHRLELTPADVAPVTLHSNPGPEHAFVDPGVVGFAGLIDFGDAYRSHPALDFRPWNDEVDVRSLYDGYESSEPVTSSFDDVRRTALIINELARAARGLREPHVAVATIKRISDEQR